MQVLSAGHAGIVKSLVWRGLEGQNDIYLISHCTMGSLTMWDVTTEERIVEHSLKTNKVSCAFYDIEIDLLVNCLQEGKLLFYEQKG